MPVVVGWRPGESWPLSLGGEGMVALDTVTGIAGRCRLCGRSAECWNVNGPACQPGHLVVIERPAEWAPIRTRPWSFIGTRSELEAEIVRRGQS